MLALGKYPEVSLADARARRDEARKLLANGVDPSENKKAVKVEQEQPNRKIQQKGVSESMII